MAARLVLDERSLGLRRQASSVTELPARFTIVENGGVAAGVSADLVVTDAPGDAVVPEDDRARLILDPDLEVDACEVRAGSPCDAPLAR